MKNHVEVGILFERGDFDLKTELSSLLEDDVWRIPGSPEIETLLPGASCRGSAPR